MNALKKSFIINILLAVLFTAIGIGLIVGGSFLKKGNDKRIAERTHVQGTVVDYVTKNSDDGIMYSEVVGYEVDGTIYYITSSASSNVYPSIGAKKEIAYNPADPQDSIIVSDSRIMNILMFGVGGVFTAVGIILIVSTVYKRCKEKNAPAESAYPGQNVYTGSSVNDMPSQPVQPSDGQPFEEFEPKDR